MLKDENLAPIFKRREEIKEQCNKLMEEYKALEYILQENIRLKRENEQLGGKKAEREQCSER